jgi:hypothetical protein
MKRKRKKELPNPIAQTSVSAFIISAVLIKYPNKKRIML